MMLIQRFALRQSIQRLNVRNNLRRFSLASLKEAPPPPPPPPGDKKGGSGPFVFLGLLAIGGITYWWDKSSADELEQAHDNTNENISDVSSIKTEIDDLASRIRSQEIVSASALSAPKSKQATTETSSKIEPPKQNANVVEEARQAIVNLLSDDNYDDGSYGPLFVRLAWHAAGTYDKTTGLGGSDGAGMRFAPESKWGANAGLDIARAKLEPIKQQYPSLSYADLWSLAGTVAIEEMGGPEMKWRPGRKDFTESTKTDLPDGLLPDADGRDHRENPADHLRDIFYRMGFNDREIVCLSGAHALGRCHTDRSGFWGPWTRAPTTFSNEYFRLLVEERWSKKKTHRGKTWNGPAQFEDSTAELMMLPSDMALVWDEKMRPFVHLYANDEELFAKDFGKAWMKLQELGVRRFHGRRRYWLFGPRE